MHEPCKNTQPLCAADGSCLRCGADQGESCRLASPHTGQQQEGDRAEAVAVIRKIADNLEAIGVDATAGTIPRLRAAADTLSPAPASPRDDHERDTPVVKPIGQESSSAEYQQTRGVAWDIVEQAINTYDSWMLDDDFEANRVLREIVEQMRFRRSLYMPHERTMTAQQDDRTPISRDTPASPRAEGDNQQ